jgi:hypothetical protein
MTIQDATPSRLAPNQPKPRANRMTKVVGILAIAALVAAVGFESRGAATVAPAGAASLTQTTAWNSASDNWSGYAETTAQTGERYTASSAEWTVPAVSRLRSVTGKVGCAALWTGIGGATSKDLIQLGTDSCANASQTAYGAWYEILPAASVEIPSLRIDPGERVNASLQLLSGATSEGSGSDAATYGQVTRLLQRFDPSFSSSHVLQELRQLFEQPRARLENEPWWPAVSAKLQALFGSPQSGTSGSSAPSSGQLWKLEFQVTSPNGSVQRWSKTLSYVSSLSSAEWITEAPTAASGVEPLPNYGTAHFIGISANATIPSVSASNEIVLGDPNGQASVPSQPAGHSDAFDTCYFPTFHVTACPDPA